MRTLLTQRSDWKMHSHCESNRGGASDEDAERVRKISLFGTNPRVTWQLLSVAEDTIFRLTMRGIPETTFRFQAVLRVSGIEEIPLKARNRGIPALTNDRMIGPPRSFKVAPDCGESEAKGQASTEGFCRASARHRWRVNRATPRRLAPSRTEMSFTASSFPTGTGSDGRPRRFPCARARSRPAIVRSFRRSRSN